MTTPTATSEDLVALARRLLPNHHDTIDKTMAHHLADVAGLLVEQAWETDYWDVVNKPIEPAIELLHRDGPCLALTRDQASALREVLEGLKVAVMNAAEYGARLGYALAVTAEHRHGTARGWLGAAHAELGRVGCDAAEHQWWRDWWSHSEYLGITAAKEGTPRRDHPHPYSKGGRKPRL